MDKNIILEKINIIYNSKDYKVAFKKTSESKNTYIKYSLEKYDLVHNTNKKFLEIYDQLFSIKFKHLKCFYFGNRSLYQDDFIETMYEHFCKFILNYNDEQIKIRYKDYEATKERMFYRLHLYIHGWTFKSIEKYINNKYGLEEVELDEFFLTMNYSNLLFVNNIKNTTKTINKYKKGRPSLPQIIKDYISEKNKEKMKKVMHDKYTFINDVKNNLLTNEEFTYINNILSKNKKNIELNKKILEKLNYLTYNEERS
jgi:hypothetical protein